MTEQNTTTAPAVEGFDLADWLVGGKAHRVHIPVTIYRNVNLPTAPAPAVEGMDALGDAPQADPLERLAEYAATVDVCALIEPEMEEAKAALGERPANHNHFTETAFWYEVFARAATLNGQTLTAEQWALLHETIGAQFGLITAAYVEAGKADVTARFRSGLPAQR